MSEQRFSRGRRSGDVIDLKSDYEVRHWTETFRITVGQLTLAVHVAGPAATSVVAYLRERKRG